jgi:hypothetical protein
VTALEDVLAAARERGVVITVHRQDAVACWPAVDLAMSRIVEEALALGARDAVLSLTADAALVRLDLRLSGLELAAVREDLAAVRARALRHGGAVHTRRTPLGAVHLGAYLPLDA